MKTALISTAILGIQCSSQEQRSSTNLLQQTTTIQSLENLQSKSAMQCGLELNKCYAFHLKQNPETGFLAAWSKLAEKKENKSGKLTFSKYDKGLKSEEREKKNLAIWKVIAGVDGSIGSISFEGLGYDEQFLMKITENDRIRNQRFSYVTEEKKQLASWQCEAEDDFIYLSSDQIVDGKTNYIGTNKKVNSIYMKALAEPDPKYGWVATEMDCEDQQKKTNEPVDSKNKTSKPVDTKKKTNEADDKKNKTSELDTNNKTSESDAKKKTNEPEDAKEQTDEPEDAQEKTNEPVDPNKNTNQPKDSKKKTNELDEPLKYKVVNNKIYIKGCNIPLPKTVKQLNIELDYFSRTFQKKYYKSAMAIYEELQKEGLNPQVRTHSWELYDKAFTFERVRRYDFVQQWMDMIEHFEDNLNENFTNHQNADQFIKVGKSAQDALNDKYHDGEFEDPANYDPEAEHPVTWANVQI